MKHLLLTIERESNDRLTFRLSEDGRPLASDSLLPEADMLRLADHICDRFYPGHPRFASDNVLPPLDDFLQDKLTPRWLTDIFLPDQICRHLFAHSESSPSKTEITVDDRSGMFLPLEWLEYCHPLLTREKQRARLTSDRDGRITLSFESAEAAPEIDRPLSQVMSLRYLIRRPGGRETAAPVESSTVKALFLGVSHTRARGDRHARYPDLPEVRSEFSGLMAEFTRLGASRHFLMEPLFDVDVNLENIRKKILEIRETSDEAQASFDVIHFSGHGEAGAPSLVMFNEILDLGRLAEMIRELGGAPPRLVISNSCFTGGEANTILDALSARAFIAPACRIPDQTASQFAVRFYNGLAQGLSIGESLLRGKRNLFLSAPKTDRSWNSYVLLGDSGIKFRAPDLPFHWLDLQERAREQAGRHLSREKKKFVGGNFILPQKNLRRLNEFLQGGKAFLYLTGEAGSGKTALLLDWAEKVGEHHAVLYISADELGKGGAVTALSASVHGVLGLTAPGNLRDIFLQVSSLALKGQKFVLVFDGLERSLAFAHDLFRHLVELAGVESENLKVIIASREKPEYWQPAGSPVKLPKRGAELLLCEGLEQEEFTELVNRYFVNKRLGADEIWNAAHSAGSPEVVRYPGRFGAFFNARCEIPAWLKDDFVPVTQPDQIRHKLLADRANIFFKSEVFSLLSKCARSREEIERAMETLRESTGLVLLTGKPGVGKTALMAQLLIENAARDIPIDYFVASSSLSSGDPRYFLKVVRRQVEEARLGFIPEKTDSAVTYSEYDPAGFKERVLPYLSKQLPKGVKLVFFIDALDEALVNRPDEQSLLSCIPAKPLYHNIVFVATAQEHLRETLDRLNYQYRVMEVPPLGFAETLRLARETLSECPFLREIPESEWHVFAERLARKSEGMPLFLELLQSDPRLSLVSSLIDLEEIIQTLPEGVENYFRHLLKLVLSTDQPMLAETLGLVCVSRAALSTTTLSALTNFSPAQTREHLKLLKPVLRGSDTGWTPFREDFRLVALDELAEDERRDYHSRLANVLNDWRVSTDACANLLYHLCLAGRIDEAFALIKSVRYRNHKIATLGVGAFEEDVFLLSRTVLRAAPIPGTSALRDTAEFRRLLIGGGGMSLGEKLAVLEKLPELNRSDIEELLTLLRRDSGKQETKRAAATSFSRLKSQEVTAEQISLAARLSAILFTPEISVLEQVESEEPDFLLPFFRSGVLYYSLGQFAASVKSLQRAVEIVPEFTEGHFELARAYSAQNMPEEALAEYEKAMELSPENPSYLYAVGQARLQARNFTRAAEVLSQAHVLAPDDFNIMLALGDALVGEGKLDSAAEFFEKARAFNPDSVAARLKIAVLANHRGDYTLAEKLSQDLAEAYPSAARELGIAKFRKERYEESAKAFEKAQAGGLADFETFYLSGRAYYAIGKYEAAEKQLACAVRISPEHNSAALAYANALFALKKYSDAEQKYRELVGRDPQNADAWKQLGSSLYLQNRLQEASEAFQKTLSLRPTDMEARLTISAIGKKLGQK